MKILTKSRKTNHRRKNSQDKGSFQFRYFVTVRSEPWSQAYKDTAYI